MVLSRREKWIIPAWPPLKWVLARILTDHGASGILSLALVGDQEIQAVHRRFLRVDRPTDVLSFPLHEPFPGVDEQVLGEVVVSAETAWREARRRGLAPESELALYAIHGTLHLVGLKDKGRDDRRLMRRLERRYLKAYDAARRESLVAGAQAGAVGREARREA